MPSSAPDQPGRTSVWSNDTMGQKTSGDTIQALLHDTRRSLVAPSRNPRMAVVIGRLLAVAFVLCFGTGLYSHFLQDPLPWMTFPTRPIWLYQVSQGIHITTGIACFPLILAKLYTVFPALFQSPPVKSVAHAVERASIALFVAASLVEITIGLLNTFQLYALFPFPFRQTHFALSFVVIGSLAIHIGVKLPVISKHWTKKRSDAEAARPFDELGDQELEGADTDAVHSTGITGRIFRWIDRDPASASARAESDSPESDSPDSDSPDSDSPASDSPATARPSTASRRGFFATVAVAVAAVVGLTAGQSFRVLDGVNFFGPRKMGVGPQGLPVNRTAKAAKVTETAVDPDWVLTVVAGERSVTFTRAALMAMPQVEVELPIACVEGWSQYAMWTGVRMRELIAAVGGSPDASVTATSLEKKSKYAVSTLGPEWVRDDLTLVALKLGGEDLDIDHGFPARLIAPARPGVLQTKWLSRIEVNI